MTAQHIVRSLGDDTTLCGVVVVPGVYISLVHPDSAYEPDTVRSWCLTCLSIHRRDPGTRTAREDPPHTVPLTTADVDRFLHQLTLDRDRPYWADRTTQLDGTEVWLHSLRGHLEAQERHAMPQDTHTSCPWPHCPYWVQAATAAQEDHELAAHIRTHHGVSL